MAQDKKDIGKILRKYGYAFPKSPDEVRTFERKFAEEFESPKEWLDIKNIIKTKDSKSKVFNIKKKENKAVTNLSMAARDGKEISQEVREKMNKDKKNASKK